MDTSERQDATVSTDAGKPGIPNLIKKSFGTCCSIFFSSFCVEDSSLDWITTIILNGLIEGVESVVSNALMVGVYDEMI